MRKFETIFISAIVGIALALHVYAYKVWLFSTGVLTHGDWVLSLHNHSLELLSLPTMWKSYNVGSVDYTPPFYIFMLIEGLLSHMGFSYAFIERISFFWPISLLTVPFCYLFVASFTKHKIAAFVGALVYAYNTYFIIVQSGHLTLMMGYAFAPLVLLFFRYTLEKRKLIYAVITGVLAFVISFYEFRAFYLVAVLAACFYVYYIFFISKEKVFSTIRSTFLLAIIPVVIVFALNSYWIIGLLSVTNVAQTSVLNRELFGKEFFSIIKATSLFHPFWTGGEYFPFITQSIPYYFFMLPIFAFVGLYVNRKNKYIVFWGIIALLGIFLTKQNNPPFPDVYYWLYTHFPGFAAFREASKFYFLIALSYSVLIASVIDWLWTKYQHGKMRVLPYAITAIIIGMCLVNGKPLMTGEFGNLFVEKTIPTNYIELNKTIDAQPEFFRTLWLPTDSRWGTNTDLHPKIGVANLLTGTDSTFSDAKKYDSLGEQFIAYFKAGTTSQLLNLTSFKYVIIPLADTANDDNFYQLFNKNRKEYIRTLDNAPFLKRISSDSANSIVYENKTYRPHIYTTSKIETLKQQIPYKKILFTPKNTTEYQITLRDISQPTYLHFTDNYHHDWKLHVGPFNWSSVFTTDYFLPDKYHFKNEAQLNSYRIDPQFIKQHIDKNNYTVNKDGSINMDLTLYFVPQSYMLLGCILSLLVASIIILFICVVMYKTYVKK